MGSTPTPPTRWEKHHTPDSWQAYADRFAQMHEGGDDLHGEARFVDALCRRDAAVLDAGCGTGRVTEGLADRGLTAVGVDKDPGLLAMARDRRPDLTWVEADLAGIDPGDFSDAPFEVIVLAGNVMVFLADGTERQVLANLTGLLEPGGRLVTGFATASSGFSRGNAYGVQDLDRDCAEAGLEVQARYATWQMAPWREDSDWAVTVIGVPA